MFVQTSLLQQNTGQIFQYYIVLVHIRFACHTNIQSPLITLLNAQHEDWL